MAPAAPAAYGHLKKVDSLERLFYIGQVTAPAPSLSLEDDYSSNPSFRLVLPRGKRDRLAERTAGLVRRRRCSVPTCHAEGMPVLLVDSELEAVLCPVHQLVQLDGSPVAGEPMLATAAW